MPKAKKPKPEKEVLLNAKGVPYRDFHPSEIRRKKKIAKNMVKAKSKQFKEKKKKEKEILSKKRKLVTGGKKDKIKTLREIIQGIKTKEKLNKFLGTLTEEEATVLLSDFRYWLMPYQVMPEGKWRRWILRGGRASGKSQAASSWINWIAENVDLEGGTIGIIARTWTDARNTLIEDKSGILGTARKDFMPVWSPGKGTLEWPNGVKARVFSADKPESIRGSNFAYVWADEFCFWPNNKKTWTESIEPALRIGPAKAIISTTPIPDSYLKKLEEMDNSVVTRGSLFDNKYIGKEKKETLIKLFEGTRSGRQELYGDYLETNLNALFSPTTIEPYRIDSKDFDYKILTKIVVAVDPAVSNNENSDQTGIIVAGCDKDGNAYILEDRSMHGTPTEWANVAIRLYHDWEANYLCAEKNQGGLLIETTIHSIDRNVAYRAVHASRGKMLRAEPVSALAAQGRIKMVGYFDKLEEQMYNFDGDPKKGSPDALDAMVYAVTELLLKNVNEPPRNLLRIYG